MTSPFARAEWKWVAGLLVLGFGLSFAAIKVYRARGHEPRFYQENFAPAVMMTCGYGFTAPPFDASPPSLTAFLRRERNTFSCADFPTPMPTETVTWNGTWYYLYGTTSLVWRVTGIAWTALDGLAAALGGIALAALYALFRLVAPRLLAAPAALYIVLSPAHLEQVPMLRDYSKGPFVLLSVLVLAWLVMRPMTARATVGFAAMFGAIVGLGYGFRSDLIVMVPFGAAMALLLLPGRWREHWRRNLLAAAAVVVTFVIAGAAPLRGQQTGGCQFHYALLGLTSPLVLDLNLDTPIYGFGDHFLDTFVDLKVGDYANRVTNIPTPNLCAPDYDIASADLFRRMATTFPADLVAHAYGSVVTILRAGFTPPRLTRVVGEVPVLGSVAAVIDAIGFRFGLLGPLVTVAATVAAFGVAPRLGLALTASVLFLGGYPAIEFEARHWFHLRFIPVWCALLVAHAWLSPSTNPRLAAIRRGLMWAGAVVVAMVLALAAFRLVQRGPATNLIEAYLAAPTEDLPSTPDGESIRIVHWASSDFAPPPAHRSSDMLVVTIAAAGCGNAGVVPLRFRYESDAVTHDMSATMQVARGAPGGPPTRVFFPVFSQGHLEHTYLKFVALETPGRPADCIEGVARVADRGAVPLWIQAQAPPDWRERPLHQRFVLPRVLR